MPGKFVNPYAGNYSATSNAVGNAVQGVVDERRAQQEAQRREEAHLADQERKAVLKETQNLQLAKMKEAQYESLNVIGDTGIKSADAHITSASRKMVDAQAANVAALKNGDIDTDQFAQKTAMIRSQVPLLKAAKDSLGSFQTNYEKLLSEDKISGADSGMSSKLYQAIQDGTVEVSPDEAGNMVFRSVEGSVPEGEEPIYMPLNSLDKLPSPTQKAPEISEIAKGPLTAIGDGAWDDAAVTKAVDSLFGGVKTDQEGEKLLKSFAVDQMGMTLLEAEEMLIPPEGWEAKGGALSPLEEHVENAIRNNVKTQYDAAQLKKEEDQRKALIQEQVIRQNELKIKNLQDPNKQTMTANQQNYEFEQQNAAASYGKANEVVNRFTTPDGISDPQGFSTALNAFARNGYSTEYNDGGWFGSGSMIIYDGDGNQVGEIDTNDKASLQPWIAKITGVDASRLPQQQPSPTKRLPSPFRRLADFVSSPFKKDPEKKFGDKKTEVGEWETLEDGRQRRVIKTSQDWSQDGSSKTFAQAGVDPAAAKAYWDANPEEYKKFKAGQQGTDVAEREEFREIQKKTPPPPPAEDPFVPEPEEQFQNASLTRPSRKDPSGTRAAHGASYKDFKKLSPEQMANIEKRADKGNEYNEARNLKTPEMLAKDRGWDLNNLNPNQKAWIDKTVAAKKKIYDANKLTLTKS